jgi:hypothetical protein
MNENDLELLHEYSKELGLYDTFTIKSLIESHRQLRKISAQKAEEFRTECKRGYDAGFESGTKHALEYNYLSREAIRNMKFRELVEILYEEE